MQTLLCFQSGVVHDLIKGGQKEYVKSFFLGGGLNGIINLKNYELH